MRRFLSFLCILSILLPSLLILTACKGKGGETPTPNTPPTPSEEKAPALYLPAAGDFSGRFTENLSTFVYSAPSLEALLGSIEIATERLQSDDTTYDAALSAVSAVEEIYADYMSMLSYAQIMYSSNKTNTYFSAEYKRLYATLPQVSFALEKLFTAVAASKHGNALAATEYFASDIVERYREGGIYTQETLPLFESEIELMLAAETISYDTVTITYNQRTDTVTNILTAIADTFGENSAEYQRAKTACDTLYNKEANKKRAENYVSLIAVRRDIADILGYESFAQLSIERLGYGASKADIDAVLDSVENYILPVYQALSSEDYFNTNTGKVEKIKFAEQTMNTLTRFYEAKGGKLFEGYNYMLHHSLISFGLTDAKRASGSYASYLDNREQPFLYLGMEGSANDYISAAKALGNALCFYQNNEKGGAFAALQRDPEITSAFSLTLGLLTLQGMKDALSKSDSAMEDSTYLVLLKNEMYNAFQLTLTQCMRTQIEWEAYALEKDKISIEAINAIIARAAERFNCFEIQNGTAATLSLSTEGLLSYDMVHTPTLTFSDVTSVYAAVSIFIEECHTAGAGFALFNELLAADATNMSYAELLSSLSIPSPADPASARTLAASIYEILTGYSYHPTSRVSTARSREKNGI